MRGWIRTGVPLAFTGILLAACQFADETLWPEKPPEGIAPPEAASEASGQSGAATPPTAPDAAAKPEPLIVIRSDRPDVAFEAPLSQTVEQVLRLRPEALFDLVAVRPGRGESSELAQAGDLTQQQAERVLRFLAGDLGLAPERVSLSATTNLAASAGEVHLYLR